MTAIKLRDALTKLINEGASEDEVLFRHSITRGANNNSPVDYILTAQTKEGVLLCYDDGAF